MVRGQREFTGMPERTKLGKKAIEYLNEKNEIDNKKLLLEKTTAELIELFLASQQKSIKVEGTLVSYAHLEKDSIKTRSANA